MNAGWSVSTIRWWSLGLFLVMSLPQVVWGQKPSTPEAPKASLETVLPGLLQRDDLSPDMRLAIQKYLQEIDEIEAEMQKRKAEATARFLQSIQQPSTTNDPDSAQALEAGLIGQAIVQGDPSGIVYHYHLGRLFPHSKLRKTLRPDHPDAASPHVTLALEGYVVLQDKTAVRIYHAAGGVNGDHGALIIGSRQLGVVGDDTAKAVIYELDLPAGKHAITWKLTGGLFQHNLLQIMDARTERALAVGFDALQKGRAVLPVYRQLMVVDDDPKEWPKTQEPREWTRVTLDWNELPQVSVME